MPGEQEKEKELERLLRQAATLLVKRPPARAPKEPADKKGSFRVA